MKRVSKTAEYKAEAFDRLVRSMNNKDSFLSIIQEINDQYKKINSKIIDQLFDYKDDNRLDLITYCYMHGSIDLLKHIIKFNEVNILVKLDCGKTPLELVIERSQNNPSDNDAELIVNYIAKKSAVAQNALDYKEGLFVLDLKIIERTNNLLQSIKKSYENNNFLSQVQQGKYIIHLDKLPDEIVSNVNNAVVNDFYYKFTLIQRLEEIGEYIGALNTHEDSIFVKNKKYIPFDLLESFHIHLQNNPLINDNPRKLFESISSDMCRLAENFSKFTSLLKSKGYHYYESQKQPNPNSYKYDSLSKINFVPHNMPLIENSIKNIQVIESLDLNIKNDKYVLVQCIQNIGEIFNHFSDEIKKMLKSADFGIKTLRDDIGHVIDDTTKFKKFVHYLEDNQNIQTFEILKELSSHYKVALNELAKQLEIATPKLTKYQNSKDILKDKWLSNIIKNVQLPNVPNQDGYVDKQLEIMKCAIGKIQTIVNDVITKENGNYNKIRQELHSPKIHAECLFFLTICGQAVQNVKSKDDFISIVTFELLQELDFIKWVRNSLMHFDKIDAKSTLIDYLANDLLTDWSIATHGQKVMEFSKYFNDVLTLLDGFQKTLTSLGDSNYFQEYKNQDQKYLDFDLKRKQVALDKMFKKYDIQEDRFFYYRDNEESGLKIEKILEHKDSITQKCQELDIKILGIFGKLAKFGYSKPEDNSGILVKSSGNDMLGSMSEFKEYIYNLLQFRIKIIEERQFIEYLEIKIDDENDRIKFADEFIKKTQNYSLDHIDNSLKLFLLVKELCDISDELISSNEMLSYLKNNITITNSEERNDDSIFIELCRLLNVVKNISDIAVEDLNSKTQELIEFYDSRLRWQFNDGMNIDISQYLLDSLMSFYQEKTRQTNHNLETKIVEVSRFLTLTEKINFDIVCDNQEPILHSLCEQYQKMKNSEILKLLRCILDKGADIGVQDIYGNTILHNISWYECDKQLLDLLQNYMQAKHYNKQNLENKCPLEIAIKQNNALLIAFLKKGTNIQEYGKELLFAATEYGNFELVEYLISKCGVKCDVEDSKGRPILHYAVFPLVDPMLSNVEILQLNTKYREIIKLLINNGAKVGQFYNGHKIETPFLWSLENKDIELSLLLAKNATQVNDSTQKVTPLHQAIINLKDCSPEEKTQYLSLIKQIIQKSVENGDSLNQEYNQHYETPLYLAAQQEEIDVMRILLGNGADVNYKNYRFIDQVLSQTDSLEVIKIFMDYGLRLNFNSCINSLKNKKVLYENAFEKLNLINNDKETLQGLKNTIKNIDDKLENDKFYVDCRSIKTLDEAKEKIEEYLKNIPLITAYLDNHAKLFGLYEFNQVEELKSLKEKAEINLKVVDQQGKDLFCYALTKGDVEFIRWLSDHDGINTQLKFLDPCEVNPSRETDYYRHLGNHATGEILEVLHNKSLIVWNEFDDYEVELISKRALQNDDCIAIKLVERHKYVFLPENIEFTSEQNQVQQYLKQYLDVFKKIENKEEKDEGLKDDIAVLQNKVVFFKDSSLIHASISVGNLEIIKFLIDEKFLDINTQNSFTYNPLDHALECNSDLALIEYLLNNGAQVGKNFDIVLMLALDINKRTLLLDHIRSIPEMRKKIMDSASSFLSDPEVIKYLLEVGFDPNQYDPDEYTIVHRCVPYERYNDSLSVLCKSEKIDFELFDDDFVALSVENDNLIGAKILVEHGVSPNKYLGILLLDALYNKDKEYFKGLLKKSIVINNRAIKWYLKYWTGEDNKIPGDKIYESFKNLQDMISDDVDGSIKEILPDHIYLFIFDLAMRNLSKTSFTNKGKKELLSEAFLKMSDEQQELVCLSSIEVANNFMESKNNLDALAIATPLSRLSFIDGSTRSDIMFIINKCSAFLSFDERMIYHNSFIDGIELSGAELYYSLLGMNIS